MSPRVVLVRRLVHGYRCQPLIECTRVASGHACVIQDAGRYNERGLANDSKAIRWLRVGRVQPMGFEYRVDPAPVGVRYQLWQRPLPA